MSKKNLEAIFFILLMAMLITGSFVIAGVRMQTFLIGYEIAHLEKEKLRLEEQARILKMQISRLHSYEELLKRNSQLQLSLVPPEEWREFDRDK